MPMKPAWKSVRIPGDLLAEGLLSLETISGDEFRLLTASQDGAKKKRSSSKKPSSLESSRKSKIQPSPFVAAGVLAVNKLVKKKPADKLAKSNPKDYLIRNKSKSDRKSERDVESGSAQAILMDVEAEELGENPDFYEDVDIPKAALKSTEVVGEIWTDPCAGEYAELSAKMPGWVKFDRASCSDLSSMTDLEEAELVSCSQSFKLPGILLKNLEAMGWMHPVEVQRRTIPVAIAKGFDMSISAETGSGKTGAFVLPVLFDILNRWSKHGCDIGQLRCVALAPSRELARQIAEVFKTLSLGTGVRVVEIFGGIYLGKQRKKISRGKPHVLVATIGRFSELVFGTDRIEAEPYLQNFQDWTHVILDEVDRLMEPGRIHAVRQVFDALLGCRREERGKWRVYVASATADMNLTVARRDKMTTYSMTSSQFIPLRAEMHRHVKIAKEADIAENLPAGLSLKISLVPRPDVKDQNLIALLTQMFTQNNNSDSPLKILVFCNSVGYVDHLSSLLAMLFCRDLNRLMIEHRRKDLSAIVDIHKEDWLDQGVERSPGVSVLDRLLKAEQPTIVTRQKKQRRKALDFSFQRNLSIGVLSIHSHKNQKERFSALEKFADPKWSGVLVATDLPARGMDFSGVDIVVHLHQPRTTQTLIHRCGRTARGPRGSGLSLFFVSPDEYQHYSYMFKRLNMEMSDIASWSLYESISSANAVRIGEIARLGSHIETMIHKKAKELKLSAENSENVDMEALAEKYRGLDESIEKLAIELQRGMLIVHA